MQYWNLSPDGHLRIRRGIEFSDSVRRAFFEISDRILTAELEEGNREVPDGLFGYMRNMKSVTLPSGLSRIGKSAFYDCGSLEEIQLPENVTVIDEWAFQDCSSLKEIRIPATVRTIGRMAFSTGEGAVSADKSLTA